MRVLEGLKPEKVFYYFEEICNIPHGSGNLDKISQYLVDFAKERGLFHIRDASKNVIIVKEATLGYEKVAPIILQGHMDMVAVREPDCDMDMAKEGLRLKMADGKVYAEGTSLGGDDGIGVAYCLALLDADIALPRLEVILTVDEETGMEGATGIDLSMLLGRRMINLDQEEEGIFITSCAGGARVDVIIPVKRDGICTDDMQLMEVKVSGLSGGHSGMEINKGRGNANCLLGEVLRALSEHMELRLVSMQGGVADNAIAREALAVLAVKREEAGILEEVAATKQEAIRRILQEGDPNVTVVCNPIPQDGSGEDGCKAGCFYTTDSTRNALDCLGKLPNGVIAMSQDVEGLVETSLNLGVLVLSEEGLRLQYAVRSSVDARKEELCRKMTEIAQEAGAQVSIHGSYPGWAYQKESALRDKMVRIYESMYGKEPVLQAIHAGLECGILSAKIEGLDCVCVGPDLQDVHTTQEKMDIASVGRVWEYLLAVLGQKD